MLSRTQVDIWLSNASFSYVSEKAINDFDTNIIGCHQVSNKVNTTKNNHRDLIYEAIV